jgi:hypothetical protein
LHAQIKLAVVDTPSVVSAVVGISLTSPSVVDGPEPVVASVLVVMGTAGVLMTSRVMGRPVVVSAPQRVAMSYVS